jgi:hypothetical protein
MVRDPSAPKETTSSVDQSQEKEDWDDIPIPSCMLEEGVSLRADHYPSEEPK